jgi:hypothetical protein
MKIKIPEVALLSFALALGVIPVRAARAQLATISVQTNVLGKAIPRDFVGLSLEVSQSGQGLQALQKNQLGGASLPKEQPEYALGRPGAPNQDFFQFMKNLGPGVLRLGGNSQDNSCWDPKQAPHPSWCQATLKAGDLKLFSTAAESTGWRLIVGLNLKQNSAAWALREITQGIALEIRPQELLGLEIGNEPDLYRRDARPASYSSEDHVRDFLNYVHAFHKNPVGRRYALVGPATCCEWRNARDVGVFIDGVGPKNLKVVTVHNYSETTCGGKIVTVAQLLAPALMARFNTEAKTWVAAAHKRGLPIALAETNSASCGGMPGVSNAFAATVWALDYMHSVAQDGFRYINFHMSYRPGGSSYNAVDTFGQQDASHVWHYRNVAEPLYYAMYLFARNASGERLLPTKITSSANIRAFAVSSCVGCAVKVFVINKDLDASGSVRVHAARRIATASLLLVGAPSLRSRASKVSYGGVQFNSNGHLAAPNSTEVRPDAGGDYTFILPNASAAMLTIPGRSRRE